MQVMYRQEDPAKAFLAQYLPTVSDSAFEYSVAPEAEIAGGTGATWTQKGSMGMSLGDMRRYVRHTRDNIQPGPIERELIDLGEWPQGAKFRGV